MTNKLFKKFVGGQAGSSISRLEGNTTSYIQGLFAFLSMSLGLSMMLFSMAVWLRFHVQIPVKDTLHLLPLLQSTLEEGVKLPLSEWWAPHAGAHRILIIRALMLLDYAFLGGINSLVYLLLWCSLTLLFLIYMRAAKQAYPDHVCLRFFIAGIVLTFLYSPSQAFNIVNPINSTWYVALAAGAVSISLFVASAEKMTAVRALLICVSAAIAAYSNFTGVIVCLLLPIIAFLHRSVLGWLVALFAIVFVSLYMQGIHSGVVLFHMSPMTHSEFNLLDTLLRVAHLTAQHLGAPLSVDYPVLAFLLVGASVLLIAYFWLRIVFALYGRGAVVPKWLEFYLLMATLCLGVSLATWFGRVIYVTPAADRYQTVAMVYWMSVCCLFISGASGSVRLKNHALIMPAVFLLSLLLVWDTFDFATPRAARFGEAAHRTQILGRLEVPHFTSSKLILPLQKRNFYMEHFDFLAGYGFLMPDDVANTDSVNPVICAGLRVRQVKSKWTGIWKLKVEFLDSESWYREIYIVTDGKVVGQLTSIVSKDFDALDVFIDRRTWRGFYRKDSAGKLINRLLIKPLLGRSFSCQLDSASSSQKTTTK